jgi:hypothetical protein
MPITGSTEVADTYQADPYVKIVSHSDLFYWWPVWAVGFLMAALSYRDGHRVAFVPDGTIAERERQVAGYEGPRDVLIAPAKLKLPVDPATGDLLQPQLRMAVSNNLGAVFVTVLLVVILVTNVRLRGVWTLVALLFVALLSVIFALKGWWDEILRLIGMVDIHINVFGYLCISSTLLAIWLFVFFFVDRLTYVTFRRGQFQVHLSIGAGETAYEVLGMVIHKRRDDLFRHWILGLGSGDLIVKTGGTDPQTFDLPNVLFIGRKLALAQQMLQEREVVRG